MHVTLNINQRTYSGWKTGAHKKVSDPFCSKFRDELGINLSHSLEMNKIVISNLPLFKKVFKDACDNLEFSKSNSGDFFVVADL